ncbi:MAG: hypothetical protein MK193_13445 [Lentisphaeria bacterium]|nr:hypothetical protein [Lentisphaeria bacterium]
MSSPVGMRENGQVPNFSAEISPSGPGYLMRSAGYQTFFEGKQHFPSGLTAKGLGFEYYEND